MTELRQELARADAMLDMKRYDQACGVLARLVAAEPENARAWCLLARAHLGAGRHQQAVDAANRAVTLDPADEWPHRLASNALLHTDNYPEALRAGMEARRLAPGHWQAHICVAQAALGARRLDIATAAAQQARNLAPNEPDVHFLSGKVSLAAGDLESARAHQERALALDPAHSGAMNELGRIRLRRHDTRGAVRHFIRAARISPSESVYSRNIDVVILRTVSRMIYTFTLAALLLIWIPVIAHLGRFPFAIGLTVLGVIAAASFAWMVLRLPPEARLLVRRTMRGRRALAALVVAIGGVALAFLAVALVPAAELPQVLPIAVVATIGARLGAFAILRGAVPRRLYPRANIPVRLLLGELRYIAIRKGSGDANGVAAVTDEAGVEAVVGVEEPGAVRAEGAVAEGPGADRAIGTGAGRASNAVGPSNAVRASNAERDVVAGQLQDAFAEGRLDDEEFDHRMRAALTARTHAELDVLLTDLPAAAGGRPGSASTVSASTVPASTGPASTVRPGRLAVAYKGAVRRAGRWRVPERYTTVVYKGSGLLDLRAAELQGPVTTIVAVAYKSRITLLVPPGVRVEMTGFGISQGQDDPGDGLALAPDAPVLHIRGVAYKGTVETMARPAERAALP